MSIAYYDEHARLFFDDTAATRVDHLYARVLAHAPAGGRVLDAGCGGTAVRRSGRRFVADCGPTLKNLG